MIKKWLKNLILWLKVILLLKKEELVSQKDETIASTGSDILEGAKVIDILSGVIQKESKWFTRENNLVQEFSGDAPIVYEPNLDVATIVKQNQYDYLRDLTLEEKELKSQELLADDIDLILPYDKSVFGGRDKIISTVDYLTDKEKFEDRWKDIKRQARQDIPETELDGETETIDGVIQE